MNSIPVVNLGDKIKTYRQSIDLTQSEFASAVDIPLGYIKAIEQGRCYSAEANEKITQCYSLPSAFFSWRMEKKLKINHNQNTMTAAQRLKILRRYRGYTLQQLASLAAVSQQYITTIEQGKNPLNNKIKKNIIDKCNLPLDFFDCDMEMILVVHSSKKG